MSFSARFLKTFFTLLFIGFSLTFSLAATAGNNQRAEKVAEVTQQVFQQALTGYGRLEAPSLYTLNALTNGQVLDLTAQPGQMIQRNIPLFKLKTLVSSDTISTQKSDLVIAETALEYADQEYQSIEKLYKKKGTYLNQLLKTKMLLLQAKANVTKLKREIAFSNASIPYLSPVSGQVSQVIHSNGSSVLQGDAIISLMPCTTLRGTLAIFDDFNQLEVGQSLQISINNQSIKTHIETIAPQLNIAGAKQVVFNLPNTQCQFKANSYIQGSLLTQTHTALAIPIQALLIQKGQTVVIVSKNNQFMLQKVTVGQKLPGLVEIIKGLKKGDKVLVDHPYEWLNKDISHQMIILD